MVYKVEAAMGCQGNRGFSLVELMIVVAIIGISAAIATLNFNQWTKKTNIEKQARELHADLNDARMQSVFLKKRHRIIMQPTSYLFKRYSSENEASAAGQTLSNKTVSYQMTTAAGGNIADIFFEFDTRGFTSNLNTIRVNPASVGAAFDCVVISNTRTNLGRMEGANCVQK